MTQLPLDSQFSSPAQTQPAPPAPGSSSLPPLLPPAQAGADLKFYAHLAWRWLWLIASCAIGGALLAYVVSINMTPIYAATSKVMINEARTPGALSYGGSYNDILASERVARTYAELMQREAVRVEAFVRLGFDPAADPHLLDRELTAVTVSPLRDTQLVALTIEGPHPALVAAAANTLPAVFVDELRTIQAGRFADAKASLTGQLDELSREVQTTKLRLAELDVQRTAQEALEAAQLANTLTQYQTAYANLLQSYEALRLTEAQATDSIVLIEPAAVPPAPVRPRVLVNVLLAALLGTLGALGAVFLAEFLDDRIRTPEDLARITPLPVLGSIAQLPDPTGMSSRGPAANAGLPPCPPLSSADPRHPGVEAYRRLRTNLQYANLDAGLRGLLITSALPGEGKSTTAANLAIVMAQAGLRVILVDADLRKPTQHRLLGLSRGPGLAEALRSAEPGSGAAADLLQPVAGVPNLAVLTSGESVPNPAEVLSSGRMRRLAAELGAGADILVFDTPPLGAVADAAVVGHLVDGAVVVVDSGRTPAAAVGRGLQALAQVHVPVLGVVLNRLAPGGRADAYYQYAYAAYASYAPTGATSPGRTLRWGWRPGQVRRARAAPER